MIRKIIKIDEEKCNGCGACAEACHEGAIKMIDGKAKLTREDYCDGLGDCLPACPANAISFEEREAPAYNEAAVLASKKEKLPCGCPGTQSKAIRREATAPATFSTPAASQLRQWPVQIRLVPVNAPYFDNANLLVAADCTAYAYGSFHNEFIRNHITLIGCPKLDEVDYTEKLTQIIANNNIKSVTIVRMEVPCCGGLENAVKRALQDSGKFIPWRVVIISTDGKYWIKGRFDKMFCFQCEQAADCKGCMAGVCGKKANAAELQDKLTGALIGLARATEENEDLISSSTDSVILNPI